MKGKAKKGLGLKRKWEIWTAFGVVFVVLLCALFAPVLAPQDPQQQQILSRLKPPAFLPGPTPSFAPAGHVLGTDALGRDLLSRLIYGARISLLVALSASAGACLLGTLAGVVAGRKGGWFEQLIMGLVNMQLSMPFILVAITLIAVTEPGLKNIVLVLIATGWASYARIARAETIKLNESGFVEAARAIGQREIVILWNCILPNLLPQIIVLASMGVGRFIILESSLSFLGLGVEPSIPTWGNMISAGRDYLATHWWLSTFPGLAVFATCLSINVIGDWLRDRLDPRG